MRVTDEKTQDIDNNYRPVDAERGRLVVVTHHADHAFIGLHGVITAGYSLLVFDASNTPLPEWNEDECDELDILVRYARQEEYITLAGDEE